MMAESLPLTLHPNCFGILTVTELSPTLPILYTQKEVSPFALPKKPTPKSVSPPTYTPAHIPGSPLHPVCSRLLLDILQGQKEVKRCKKSVTGWKSYTAS